METNNQATVKTLSMVKLGKRYYALEDAHAVHVNGLEKALLDMDPAMPVTMEYLKQFYQPVFYSDLGSAAADINAGTVGINATGAETAQNLAVYTDFSGAAVVVLLEDITLSASVQLKKTVKMQLNGKTVSLNTGVKLVFANGTNAEGAAVAADAVIDGRVPGSGIQKTAENSTANEFLVEAKGQSITLLGGTYQQSIGSTNYAVVALLVRNTACRMEDSHILSSVGSGSGNVYCIQHANIMQMTGCKLNASSDAGVCRGFEAKGTSSDTVVEDCVIATQTNTGLSGAVDNKGVRIRIADSTVTVQSTTQVSDTTGSTAAYGINLACGQLFLTNSILTVETKAAQAFTVYLNPQTNNEIHSCQLYAASEGDYAKVIHNCAAAVSLVTDTVCFADGISGDGTETNSVGILNHGNMTLVGCTAYGTHCGMWANSGSFTHVTGGRFEGVGHGGIYFSHAGGQAYVQDAAIANARYRGRYKDIFHYGNGYYYSAGMYIGDDGVSNTAAYLDNCRICGGTGSAIVMRGSGGEQNNAFYLSNCDVTGGTIRIDSDTHRIYVGKACNIAPAANLPDCVVQTDAVYPGFPQAAAE